MNIAQAICALLELRWQLNRLARNRVLRVGSRFAGLTVTVDDSDGPLRATVSTTDALYYFEVTSGGTSCYSDTRRLINSELRRLRSMMEQ